VINILVVGSSNTDMVIRVSKISKPGAQPSAPTRAEIGAFLRANTKSIAHKSPKR
jgi:hypothetical protein